MPWFLIFLKEREKMSAQAFFQNKEGLILSPLLNSALLPLLAHRAQRRFDPLINEAWQVCTQRLLKEWRDLCVEDEWAWNDFHRLAFQAYRILLKTNDPYCLPLAEALLNAVGRLESLMHSFSASPLRAALSTCFEVMSETDLEHPDLNSRLSYFTKRLAEVTERLDYAGRSEIIDQLFLDEAAEQLELIHGALNELPPNVETLQLSADWLVQEAMQIELNEVATAARRLEKAVSILADDPTNEMARLNVFSTVPEVVEKIRAVV